MTSFFHMTVSASVLITAIIIIRALFLHKLSKRVFVLLWTVAVLRLLVPFSFSVDIPAINSLNKINNAASKYTVVVNYANENWENRAVTDNIADHSEIIGLIWLCGAVVCWIGITVSHMRYKKRYDTAVLLKNTAINDYIKSSGIKRRITVKVSGNIDSPMTTGAFHPVIYLPKSIIAEDNKDEINFVLAHELIHIRRFDVLYKFALAVAVCLHWFNIFVWVMYFLAVRDIELSCDEEVLHKIKCGRSDYAMALINLEEKRSISLTASCFSNNAVKERIEAIMRCKRISAMGSIVSFCLLTCSTAVFTVGETSAVSEVRIVSAAEEYPDNSTAGDFAVSDELNKKTATADIYDHAADESTDSIQYAYYEETEDAAYGDIAVEKAAEYDEVAMYEVAMYEEIENAVYGDIAVEEAAEYNEVTMYEVAMYEEPQIEYACMESEELDGNYLSGYFVYCLSFDDNEMCYVYNGKNVAGFIDDGYVFLIDGEQVENNGIYVTCVRKNNAISGLKEITATEFEQLQ